MGMSYADALAQGAADHARWVAGFYTSAAEGDAAGNAAGMGRYSITADASLWGKPIPITWGRRKITGQLLQIGIQQQKTSVIVNHYSGFDIPSWASSQGIFTGNYFNQVETYNGETRFTSTFAYVFGAPGNPDATQILKKLWFNGQLVYDIDQGYLSNEIRFKFYQGDELQTPDGELNRARYEFPVGYRGLMYVVFYEYSIKAAAGTGNPLVEAEFAEQVVNNQPTYAFDLYGDPTLPGIEFHSGSYVFDPKKGVIYSVGSNGRIYKLRATDRSLLDDYPVTGPVAPDGIDHNFYRNIFCFFRLNGVPYLIGTNSNGSNSSAIHVINADTGVVVSYLGENDAQLITDGTHFPGLSGATATVVGELTGEVAYVTTQSVRGISTLFKVNGEGAISMLKHKFYAVGHTQWSLSVRQDMVLNTYDLVDNLIYKNGTLFRTCEHDAQLIFSSPLDESIVIFEREDFDTQFNIYKLMPDGSVPWLFDETNSQLEGLYYDHDRLMQSNTAGQRIAWRVGPWIYTLNFLAGSYERTAANPADWLAGTNYIYDAYTHSFFIAVGLPGRVEQHPILQQTSGDMLLSTLLRNLAVRQGYLDANITVEGIPDTIIGAAITEVSDLNSVLEDIRIAYNFEIIKRGPNIRFTRRGYGSDFEVDASIDEQDRAILSEDEDQFVTVESEITAAKQSAGTIRLRYIDPDYNYVRNEFTHKRNGDDTDASTEMVLTLPIIMQGSEAAALAVRILLNASANGLTHDFRLPQKYLAIEPGDVIELVFDDYVDTVRCVEIAYNADWSMSIKSEAILTDIGPTYQLEPPVLPPENPSLLSGEAAPLIFDTTLIRPEDQQSANLLEMYVGAFPSGRLPVVGTNTINKAIGSAAFGNIGTLPEALTFGSVTGAALPDAAPWQIDYLATMEIRLLQGDGTKFQTATVLEMLDGANRLLVGKAGRWEQIGFIEASFDSATKLVTLTGLVRGLRGTELNTNAHVAADLAVLIEETSMLMTTDNVSERFTTVKFAIGDNVGRINYNDAAAVPVLGASRMPWAPTNVHVIRDGTDLDLTWHRRTRLLGPLVDLSPDVPLDEASELYTVVLYRAGAIVRTVEGLTTPAFTYTAAMMTADGWSGTVTSLQLDVYQISELTGRGFPQTGTYDVQ